MTLAQTLGKYRTLGLDIAERHVKPLALLLLRVSIGLYFAVSGWGKIHHLDKVTAFFTELKIPMPHAQAVMVSCVELFGGLAVTLGVLTRLAAIPLSATMVVAILTAKLPDLGKDAVGPGQVPTFGDKFASFFSMDELVFLAIFAALVAVGPGAISVDHFLAKLFPKKDDGASKAKDDEPVESGKGAKAA